MQLDLTSPISADLTSTDTTEGLTRISVAYDLALTGSLQLPGTVQDSPSQADLTVALRALRRVLVREGFETPTEADLRIEAEEERIRADRDARTIQA